jgi:hypothetical protein
MPLPLIPIAAILTGAFGLKKGLDAKKNFEKAEKIGRKAKKRHEQACLHVDAERESTNQSLTELGTLKVRIFSNQIKHLVDVVTAFKKQGTSTLKGFDQEIKALNVPEMEKMVLNSLELEKCLASGVVSGTLAELGAYGSVGMLATASTGTAIANLGGIATNATLAWLGGGSLAAGGLGIAGGTAILGGIVAGPAIAITGLLMASKAETALSDAHDYAAKADKAIAKIQLLEITLKGLQLNITEMSGVLTKLASTFDAIKVYDASDEKAFKNMMALGKTLKKVLDTPIMENDGGAVKYLKEKIALTIKTSGLLEYRG